MSDTITDDERRAKNKIWLGITTPVENPNWQDHIQWFFTHKDIGCMGHSTDSHRSIHLDDYDSVKIHAGSIYSKTWWDDDNPWVDGPPNYPMPLGGPKWSQPVLQTFQNWKNNHYPHDNNPVPPIDPEDVGSRERKNYLELTDDQKKTLIKAYNGVINNKKPFTDKNSFHQLAKIHADYCPHDDFLFIVWHRAYMLAFENALRAVPGCKDVTLPYWDLTMPAPDDFFTDTISFSDGTSVASPFLSYTMPYYAPDPTKPEELKLVPIQGLRPEDYKYPNDPRFNASGPPYKTAHTTQPDINTQTSDFNKRINDVLRITDYVKFNQNDAEAPDPDSLQNVHNTGHVKVSNFLPLSLISTVTAGYDPVFWMFHANWDRIFWTWQKYTSIEGNDMTTWANFNKYQNEDGQGPFRYNGQMDGMPDMTFGQMIDITNEITYSHLAGTLGHTPRVAQFNSVNANQKFSLAHSENVQVKVSGIKKLEIPGTFIVHLLRDGKVIASRHYLQSSEPKGCPTCTQKTTINSVFSIPREELNRGKISCEIELGTNPGKWLPHELYGNPSISVSIPLRKES